jgi:peroxiredoxin Q/BCP
MARLRDAYNLFRNRRSEVLVVGPEGAAAFRDYWLKHRLPFVGLPDPRHEVLKRYGQQVKLFKLGRLPAQLVVDRRGQVRFVYYGHSMQDIPPNSDLLAILDELNRDEAR